MLNTLCSSKLWFTAKLRQLRQAEEEAYSSGDKTTLPKEIKVAKKRGPEKLKNTILLNTTLSVWKVCRRSLTTGNCPATL